MGGNSIDRRCLVLRSSLDWRGCRMSSTALYLTKTAADRARRLAAEARYREAIDVLSRERPESLDLQSLRDLVRWRNAAFDPEVGHRSWPPDLPDPFAGGQEPPEIRGGELTADI